ncbi:hypothetical protein F4820DRAFT_404874 [Hypoxylon rubiginosum]|uniref:Uncharacterized protein n=1 Tax=Hypoxylon rubiginosum TaxID=110542 RepID=A0ACB9ZE84_9PEZI|nr:hypothetical protein F4820DRAFT_404874 [Hypoxylon rubiginosum]
MLSHKCYIDDCPSVPLPAIRFISKYPSCTISVCPIPRTATAYSGSLPDFLYYYVPTLVTCHYLSLLLTASLDAFALQAQEREREERLWIILHRLTAKLPPVSLTAVSGPFALRSSAAPPFSFWCVVKLPMGSTLITGLLYYY